MNSACPSCGAVYAVTAKDVGRKIKCKKCSTGLRVDDSGLVVDAPGAPPPTPSKSAPALAAVVEEDEDDAPPPKKGKRNDDEEDEVVPKKGKKAGRTYTPGSGGGLSALGGVPTILFAPGVFLVLWFTFMDPIGQAAVTRANAGVGQLRSQQQAEIKKLLPKGKKSAFELSPDEQKAFNEKQQKIVEDYQKKFETATEEAESAEVGNARSAYFEKYGQLLGFILVAFGCIGYLRTEQPMVMRVVAGSILVLMMFVVFVLATAGGCGGGPRLPTPRPGKGID